MSEGLINEVIEILEQDKTYNVEQGNEQAALLYACAIKIIKEYQFYN